MHIGAHVSVSGGLWNAPINAAALGCETFQFFSRSPQGGVVKPITEETVVRFRETMKSTGITTSYIHAPYILNLASPLDRIFKTSVSIIRQELERGSLLGCKAVMFHPGSSKGQSKKQGTERIIDGLDRILNEYSGSCQLLIENSAGAGNVMGDTFEEIATFIDGTKQGEEIGICLDTQHAFASGYNLQTAEGLDAVLKTFAKTRSTTIISINSLLIDIISFFNFLNTFS